MYPLGFGNATPAGGRSLHSVALSDYYEWRAGTDPRDPLSSLMVADMDGRAGAVALYWFSIAGRTYRVERSYNLSDPQSFHVVEWGLPATPPVNAFADPSPDPARPAFYRIVLE